MKYEDVAVPFQTLGNRQVLGDQQLLQEPWLGEFLTRFRHCFERNDALCCYVYCPPKAPRVSLLGGGGS